MKADQIRQTLQPMVNFAPAILAAAEIVEAAEAAETRLESVKAEERDLKTLIEKHKNNQTDFDRVLTEKRERFIKERDELEAQAKSMREAIEPLKDQVDKLKAKRDEQQALFDKVAASIRKETLVEQSKLDVARKAYADFKAGLKS